MPVLSIPNVFVQGTTINAAPFNANFNAVATSVNNVDNSQIGAAGIFASQIIPTSSAFATFGGTVGYSFYNATAGVTPLTVSGVAGQSVDIFDVTLTSGGTKAIYVDSFGNFAAANNLFSVTQSSGAVSAAGGKFLVSAGGTVAATAASGTTGSFVPPVYTGAGGAVANTVHAVVGTFPGTGAAVATTLGGAAVFVGTGFFVAVVDANTGVILTNVSITGANQFTVAATTNGHTYQYFCFGT